MVASEFLDYVSKLQVITHVGIEDFSERFNYLLTVIVFLICCIIVTTKQYVFRPISCFSMHGSEVRQGTYGQEFVDNYCWVHGTIPFTRDAVLPSNMKDWDAMIENEKLTYYQWIPFVLALQAICFYLPKIIWQFFCYNRAGTNVAHIVINADQAVHSSEDAKIKMVKHIAKTIEQMLHHTKIARKAAQLSRKPNLLPSQMAASNTSIVLNPQKLDTQQSISSHQRKRAYSRGSSRQRTAFTSASSSSAQQRYPHRYPACIHCFCNSLGHIWHGLRLCNFKLWNFSHRHLGSSFIWAYMFLKLLILVNCIGQLFLIYYFLNLKNTGNFIMTGWGGPFVFGYDLLLNIIKGRTWKHTLIFPRLTFCPVSVRDIGTNMKMHVAQCVLPVNMLNERIYVFLYFWIMMAALITLCSLPVWFVKVFFRTRRRAFIRQFLLLSDSIQLADLYVDEYKSTDDDSFMIGAVSSADHVIQMESMKLGSGKDAATPKTPAAIHKKRAHSARVKTREDTNKNVKRFERDFLRHDGVFILQMICLNCGDLITADLVAQLWKLYVGKHTRLNTLGVDQQDTGNKIVKLNNDMSLSIQPNKNSRRERLLSGQSNSNVFFPANMSIPMLPYSGLPEPTAPPPTEPIKFHVDNAAQLNSDPSFAVKSRPPLGGGSAEKPSGMPMHTPMSPSATVMQPLLNSADQYPPATFVEKKKRDPETSTSSTNRSKTRTNPHTATAASAITSAVPHSHLASPPVAVD